MKVIADRKIEEADRTWSQFRNWGTESARQDAKNCFYPVMVRDGMVVGFGDVCDDNHHPEQTETSGDTLFVYPIDTSGVERKWRYARQSADSVLHLLRAKKSGSRCEIEIGKDSGLHRTVWTDKRYDANEHGSRLLQSLVPDSSFSFPKSLWAVYDCLSCVVQHDPDAIVLDFFAGSGTTGHALVEMNNNDGGKRRFILVQIPEETKGSSKYETIPDITKARLRSVSGKLSSPFPSVANDTGFRVFKLDSSNIRAWDPCPTDLEQALLSNVEHIKEGRSEQDVLYEVLLKLGLDLCAPIDTREIAGKQVHTIGNGALLACLPEQIAPAQAEALALGIVEWLEQLANAGDTTVVFRDSAFADDVSKTNLTEILRQHGFKDVRSL